MSDITIEREQKIRELAYYLWDKAGRPSGKEDEFWCLAEAEYERRAAKLGVEQADAPFDHIAR